MNVYLRSALLVLGVVGGIFLLDFLLHSYRLTVLPKNLGTVRAGVLYRSGGMQLGHFEDAIRRHGIRMVVNLNPRLDDPEEKLCARLGVNYFSMTMPGNGMGEPEKYHRFVELLDDPSNRPILVHCAAGAYRTGVCCAMYRMVYEGWTIPMVEREMRYYGFRGESRLITHIQTVYATIPTRIAEKRQRLASEPLRY